MTLQKQTLAEKILSAHRVTRHETGAELIHIDRLYMDESAYNCLLALRKRTLAVPNPSTKYLFVSHLAPIFERANGPTDPEVIGIFGMLEEFAEEYEIDLLHLEDERQGIYHVVAPEQGMTLPGMIVTGTDSHMCTQGGIGALGLTVGYEDAVHVLANDSLWLRPFKSLLVSIDGTLPDDISAKDLALYVLGAIGAKGALGYCIEFTGSTVSRLDMSSRMTLCNLMLEAGARSAIIAPDDTTLEYVSDRPLAPKGAMWDKAAAYWRTLTIGDESSYARHVSFQTDSLAPMVSWGTTPDQVAPITACVPNPALFSSAEACQSAREALEYMDLVPGTPLDGVRIDDVFIGSCTNGRIEDLRAAAEVLQGRRAAVPGLVVAGSTAVQKQAEAEGLDTIFTDAGLKWGAAGCALCFGHHDVIVGPGRRCAATTNRNFPGRQGPHARTHLMSPAMAAAAAVSGTITDPRKLEGLA